ncbi:aldo/keto reductase [Lasiosphaeria ovina]|uniref:Aldo/keto reductase n=1 Tax=Lasiosphaeria ovina TaxID=92902 RepID=A0AAE0JWD4_9PEZI|nr:aldo/keto reductase [Lasiosphaeria ovina]
MSIPAGIQESLKNTKCQYRQMGTSGLCVSVSIFGCGDLGDPRIISWAIQEDGALPLLKAAYDRGLDTWDTAIKKYQIPRAKVVLITKCYWAVGERQWVEASKDYQNQFGLSRAATFNQIYCFDTATPIEETMQAPYDLLQQGKVRCIGASSMWATQFARMQFAAERHGWTRFREMVRICHDTGVGLTPWVPLCRGHLARPPAAFGSTVRSREEKEQMPGSHGTAEPDLSIIRRVQEVAEKRDWPMSHVALAWLNKRVTSPVVGFSSIARMDELLESSGEVLADEEEKYLEELYLPKAIRGHV